MNPPANRAQRPPRPEAAAASNDSMILGEIRGQLREVVHNQNNFSTKLDALTREVIGLGAMAEDVGGLKARVAALEVEKNRTDGAKGIAAIVLKSPAIGWMVGFAATVWAVVTGKVHL